MTRYIGILCEIGLSSLVACIFWHSFEPLIQERLSYPKDRTSSSEWPARKAHIDTPRSAKATPTEQEQEDPGTIALQSLQSQPPSKLITTTSSSVTLERYVRTVTVNVFSLFTKKRTISVDGGWQMKHVNDYWSLLLIYYSKSIRGFTVINKKWAVAINMFPCQPLSKPVSLHFELLQGEATSLQRT